MALSFQLVACSRMILLGRAIGSPSSSSDIFLTTHFCEATRSSRNAFFTLCSCADGERANSSIQNFIRPWERLPYTHSLPSNRAILRRRCERTKMDWNYVKENTALVRSNTHKVQSQGKNVMRTQANPIAQTHKFSSVFTAFRFQTLLLNEPECPSEHRQIWITY